MKKYYSVILIIYSLLLSVGMQAQSPFTAGNIVVVRVGDGAAPGYDFTVPIFLDEYNSAGSLVQSIPLPATNSGSNRSISTLFYFGRTCFLTLSPNKQFLSLVAFATDAGTGNDGGLNNNTAVDRTIASIDYNGIVNTSTSVPFADVPNSEPRGVITDDGTRFWSSYTGPGGGIKYSVLGQSGSTPIVQDGGVTTFNIYNSQLYCAQGDMAASVSGGLPTTGPQTLSILPGFTDNGGQTAQMFFADLNPSIPGFDVIYLADGEGDYALTKFSFDPNNNTWVNNGTIGSYADNYRGITGVVNGNSVTLYCTRAIEDFTLAAGEVVKLIDNTGYSLVPNSFTGTPTLFLTPPTNYGFRGIAMAPEPPPACLSPTVALDFVTPTTASFSWPSIAEAGSFEYAITTSATPPESGTSLNTLNYSASELIPNTSYYFHLRTVCLSGSFSQWVSVPFQTQCYAPAQLSVSNITNTSALVSWTNNPGVSGYEYAATTSSTPPTSGTSTTNSSVNIGSLTGGTTYYIYVRSKCSNEFSPWITTKITTGCFKPQANVAGVEANSDAATIEWNSINGSTTQYEYALMNSTAPIIGSMRMTSDTSIRFSGLHPGTNYYLHVRSRCAIMQSDWTIVPFTINGLNVFPNPAKDILTVTIDGASNSNGQLFIYDAMGKLAKKLRMTTGTVTVDVRDLSRGVYLAKYMDGNRKFTVKITKE